MYSNIPIVAKAIYLGGNQIMGNRAVITTKDAFENDGIGIYLHWNGGRDSVVAFLEYCKLKGYRSPAYNSEYAMARLVQVISNFFGGTDSIGIGCVNQLDCDNCDNGTYIIGGNWEIVGREYHTGKEQANYPLLDMLQAIDEQMPANEQLGEYITAKVVPTSELKVGDTVMIVDYADKLIKAKVVGVGEDRLVNGTNVKGIPYTDRYNGAGYDNGDNINNYLLENAYRIVNQA